MLRVRRYGLLRAVCAVEPRVLLLLLLLLTSVSAAASPPPLLRLPVAASGAGVRPSYRSDVLELKLRPHAAAAARSTLATLRPGASRFAVDHLGVASLDGAARRLGGLTFEPEFPGEPPLGSSANGDDFTSYYVVRLPPDADLVTALVTLRSLPEVESVHAVALLRSAVMPNDSLWAQSWWLYNAAGRHDIHAPEAWDVSTGDALVKVAILDTGVLPYHPDLGGALAGGAGNIWTNAAEASGFTGVDDDGNGYVDDVHGWDFVDLPSQGFVSPGEDWKDEDNDPNDYSGHGTAVAGLAGARSNNGIGTTGVAWNVRIIPLRTSWAELGEPFGIVDMVFAARAIRYATRVGADIVNCSFETDTTAGLLAAARAAARAGVLIVNAAGNGGSPFHALADREDVLAVAATDVNDQLSPVSNRGAYVDVSAPGVLVASTYVVSAGTDSVARRTPSYRPGITGTSFASPIAAGTAALVVAHQRITGEPLRRHELLLRLRETTDDITAANPGESGYGTGRINAFTAVTRTEASFAVEVGGVLTGAPALITGPDEHVWLCTIRNRVLLFVGAVTGDTLARVSLPAAPFGSPAAADLGGGTGPSVFVALEGGALAGYDASGVPLAGWPVSVAGDAVALATSPALGDLDGDGVLEVVCGSNAGSVYAWRLNGTRLDGFPAPLDGSELTGLAISPLDAAAGAEIVVSTQTRVHAIRFDATSLAGWPRTLVSPPSMPLVARLGERTTPCVIVTFGNSLRAYEAGGATRWTRALGAMPAGPPSAADVDGDGYDEVVLPTVFPATIAVHDSGGVALVSRGFPATLAGAIAGEVVVRPIDGTPAAHLYAIVDGRLRAIDSDARALRGWPSLGAEVATPSVYVTAPSGLVRAATGSAGDSLFYFYKTEWSALTGAERGWYTVRGNFARTGSRLYVPPLAAVDPRPARVADLLVASAGDTEVGLRWTASGENGLMGRPQSYEIHAAFSPIRDGGAFAAAPYSRTIVPAVDGGGVESYAFDGLPSGRTLWFALVATDAQSLTSVLSNTVSATTGPGGPLAGVAGPAIASLAQPSRLPASLYWKGEGAAAAGEIRVYDLRGRRVRMLPFAPATSGVVQWNGRDEGGGLVPAGVYFARLTSGSIHAQARVVLLP